MKLAMDLCPTLQVIGSDSSPGSKKVRCSIGTQQCSGNAALVASLEQLRECRFAAGRRPWTINSHLGGEEQALFGLLSHDNSPSWKLGEFASIASELKELEKSGFQRYMTLQVAIAYSLDSFIDSHPNGPLNTTRQYFKTPYSERVVSLPRRLKRRNPRSSLIWPKTGSTIALRIL